MGKFSDRFRELWNQDDFDDDYEEDEYDEEENDTADYLYGRGSRSSARGRRDTETSQKKNTGKRHSERRTRSTEEELEDDFMRKYATTGSRSQSRDNNTYGNYRYQSDNDYSSYSNTNNDYSNTSSGYQKNYDNSTPEYGYSSSASSYSDKTFFDINATTKLRVVCVKPQSYGNDIKYIADQLIENYTILLNFEETPKHDIRSIIDFISGCAYVKHGKVQRIAKNIFIVTPDNVELKGDSLIGELANNGVLIVE